MNLSATLPHFDQFQEATACNPELVALRDVIIKGWPDTRGLPRPVASVLNIPRIVVPVQLRGMVLHKIHLAHQGIEKCKLHAKSAFYWVGMYADIEELVRKCGTCQNINYPFPKNPYITMTSHPARGIHCPRIYSIGNNQRICLSSIRNRNSQSSGS